MKVTVYGIPTCATVKKARAWLDEHRVEHEWVDLRDKAPSRARLSRWVRAFGVKAMRNTSSGSYRALGPEKKTWPDDRWIAAFAADLMLLKRPVVEVDGEPAAVGFDTGDFAARLLP
jgi:arsenate reductase